MQLNTEYFAQYYPIVIMDHRYGMGYYAAILPSDMVEDFDLWLNAPGEDPMMFADWQHRSCQDGLPIANGKSIPEALMNLELNLNAARAGGDLTESFAAIRKMAKEFNELNGYTPFTLFTGLTETDNDSDN